MMGSLQALQDKFGRPLSFLLRVRAEQDKLPALAEAIRAAGAELGEPAPGEAAGTYDIRVFAKDDAQMTAAGDAAGAVEGVRGLDFIDLAMETHRGGACEMRSRCAIASNTDLRIVYTPGVARVCKAIQADPALARTYTKRANRVETSRGYSNDASITPSASISEAWAG
jgi:malate dehydrogenase (oxaloacetate-decarboxylating)